MKIYIVKDDAYVREMLTSHLPDFCPGNEVIGANGNGQTVMSECTELKPDLNILDIRLPELSGSKILSLIKEKFPQIRILIYSGLADLQSIKNAKCGKADGYILKNYGLEEIAKVIKVIEVGGTETINVMIQNFGEFEGTYPVTLAQEPAKPVTLMPAD